MLPRLLLMLCCHSMCLTALVGTGGVDFGFLPSHKKRKLLPAAAAAVAAEAGSLEPSPIKKKGPAVKYFHVFVVLFNIFTCRTLFGVFLYHIPPYLALNTLTYFTESLQMPAAPAVSKRAWERVAKLLLLLPACCCYRSSAAASVLRYQSAAGCFKGKHKLEA